MRVRSFVVSAVLLPVCLALTACQPDLAAAPDPMAPTCGADALQALVGEPLSAFTAPPQARAVRVIGPDMAVTMDYRPDRLNVEHDRDQVIRRVSCG
jgi:hypothetical protein